MPSPFTKLTKGKTDKKKEKEKESEEKRELY